MLTLTENTEIASTTCLQSTSVYCTRHSRPENDVSDGFSTAIGTTINQPERKMNLRILSTAALFNMAAGFGIQVNR